MPNVIPALERLIREYGEKGAEREARALGKKLTAETAEEILQKANARETAFAKSAESESSRVFNPITDEPSPEEVEKFAAFLSQSPSPPRIKKSSSNTLDSIDTALEKGTPEGTWVEGSGEAIAPEASASTATSEELDAFADRLRAQDKKKPGIFARNKGKTALGAAGLGAGAYALSGGGDEASLEAKETPPTPPSLGVGTEAPATQVAPVVPMPTDSGKWRQAPLKKPEDVATLLSKYKEELSGLKGPAKATLTKRLGELDELASTVQKEYKDKKSRLEWAEVAETLGHAFSQLGAGLQGMRTGVDLSGIPFNKTDWDSKSRTALDALKSELSDLQAKREGATREFETESKQAERLADAGLRAGLSDREATQSENWKRERANKNKEFQISDREDRQAHALEELGAKEDAKAAGRPDKAAEKRNSALARATAELVSLKDLRSSERPKAVRQIVSNYYRDAGVAPPDQAKLEKAIEQINDPGFWSDPDPSALADLMRDAAGESPPSGTQPSLVSIQKAGAGQIFQVTPEQAQKLIGLNAGWQRVGH